MSTNDTPARRADAVRASGLVGPECVVRMGIGPLLACARSVCRWGQEGDLRRRKRLSRFLAHCRGVQL